MSIDSVALEEVNTLIWMVVVTLVLIWYAWDADVMDIKMVIMMIRQYFTL